jgi:hypothetical protein
MADIGSASSSQIASTVGNLFTKGSRPANFTNAGLVGYGNLAESNETIFERPSLYTDNKTMPYNYNCQTRVLACNVVNGPNVAPSVNVHAYGAVYGDCNNCSYKERVEMS